MTRKKELARDTVRRELMRIQRAEGLLRADSVVAYARAEESPLHSLFEWNDAKASHEYRLEQARHLIRVVVFCEPKSNVTTRAFVSLTTDRTQRGGGYRFLVDVMGDAELREQLLAEALAELARFRAKYAELRALAPVFAAMKTVERRRARRAAAS